MGIPVVSFVLQTADSVKKVYRRPLMLERLSCFLGEMEDWLSTTFRSMIVRFVALFKV